MPTYAEMDNVQLAALKEELEREYGEIKARGLALNMARGKPAKAQLDLSMPLLETVTTMEDCVAADGTDCRNYGVGFGLPEAKEFMACMPASTSCTTPWRAAGCSARWAPSRGASWTR